MKTSSHCPSFLAAALCALALLTAACAEEANSSVIKFSDPTKPGTLKITASRGDIRVHGTDSADVSVKSEAKAVTPTPRKDGLRVITSSSSFTLSEKNNVVVIDATAEGWDQSGGFDVMVPKSCAVIIGKSWGGAVTCSDLTGDIEIKSMNGRIKLNGIAGGALVETMNGEIEATVSEIHEGKPLSFTSMNGQIAIRVPEQSKANVNLRSQNGAILTDFDEKALVTETKSVGRKGYSYVATHDSDMKNEIQVTVREAVQAGMDAAREAVAAVREATESMKEAADEDSHRDPKLPRAPKPPKVALPPMTGGKIVSGTLNGGGSEIQAATMNGDVILRKLDPKK